MPVNDQIEISQSIANIRPSEDLSGHRAIEDWTALVLFLALCFVVFLQFFTRYVLNNSFGWTEEIARYLLIGVVFVGAAMCVRRRRHIQVNFLYRLLPKAIGHALARIVDVIAICFFFYSAWLMWQLIKIIGDDRMTLVHLPMSTVYYFVFAGLFIGGVRAIGVFIEHARQGFGPLEKPEQYLD